MEGLHLDAILKTNHYSRDAYHGIFTFNEVWPHPVSLPASYVFNTDKSSGQGQHWICFQINKDLSVDYMDSFGTAPMKKPYKWIKTAGFGPVRFNKKWLQNPLSSICWAYTIYFLIEKGRGKSLEDILSPFESFRFEFNDSLVLSRLCARDP